MADQFTNPPLTSGNYNDSVNGVTQTANQLYSSGRGNNASRAIKIVSEQAKKFIPATDGFNYWLDVSFAAGLYVTLKTKDNNDPSAMNTSDPLTTPGDEVGFRIGREYRKVTTTTLISLSNGTNWFGLGDSLTSNSIQQLFVYAIWNSNTNSVNLSLCRYPWLTKVSQRNTTQNHPAYMPVAGDSGISGTAPASTDDCVVIGRINVNLSGTSWVTTNLGTTGSSQNIVLGKQNTTDGMGFVPYVSGQAGSRGTFALSNATGTYRIVNDMVIIDAIYVKISNLGSYSSAVILVLPMFGSTNAEYFQHVRLVAQGSNPATSARGIGTLANNSAVDSFANNYQRLIFITGADTSSLPFSSCAVNDIINGTIVYRMRPGL